jgi:hypothetical protein
MPLLLLGFVAVTAAVPLDVQFSAPWKAVLNSLHITSLMTSGPLGIVVTLAAEENFPRDQDWMYGLLLAGVTAAQWFGVFRIGQYWLRYAGKSRRSAFVLCLGVVLVTFGAAFVLQILILAGRRS